jgi:O-antigen/teichoic acid export membrane protein
MNVRQTVADFSARILRQSIIIDGALTLIIKVLSAGLSYVMFVVIANALSEGEYGRFGFGFALGITLANVATLGTPTSLLRFLPQYIASHRLGYARGYALFAGKAVAIVTLVISVAVAGIAFLLASGNGTVSYLHVFAAVGLILATAFSDYISGTVRGIGLLGLSQIPKDIIWRLLVCGFILLSAMMDWQQTGASILQMCFLLLFATTVLQFALARRRVTSVFLSQPAAYDKKTWTKAALPMWGAASLMAMVQQFDVVILGFFGHTTDSGPYFAALRTASLLSLMLLAGNLAAAPLMSSLYHTNDKPALAKMVRLIALAIGIPTVLGLGFLAVFGKWLLTLFGGSFDSAFPILMVLATGYTADALAGPTAYLLQMTGHETSYLKTIGTSYAAVIALQAICIPIYGLMGAAVPSALGMVFTAAVAALLTRKYLGINPSIAGALGRR